MAPSKKKQKFTEALIQDIQFHPALWDKTNKDHKDVMVCANAWNDIQANLQASHSGEALRDVNLHTVKGIKSHWKNLQDTYKTKKRKAKGKSGAGRDDVPDPRKWIYFKMLRFLDQANSFGLGASSSSQVHLAADEHYEGGDEEAEDDDTNENSDNDDDDEDDDGSVQPRKHSQFDPLLDGEVSEDEIVRPNGPGIKTTY